MTYFVYILECADGSLYTGITNDLEKRIDAHNSESSTTKYTRGRRPVTLVYSEQCKDKGTALQREIVLKKLSREQKITLIQKL